MSQILGEIGDVKKSLIQYMESYTDSVHEPESYIPSDILEMMLQVTCELGREIAVTLDRKNRVTSITVGDSRSVPLSAEGARRSSVRLSGIRLLHTHPNGTAVPSGVDLNSLTSMRYDSMVVIGVNCERGTVTGISAATLDRNADGAFEGSTLHGPYLRSERARLDELFLYAEEIDRAAPEKLNDAGEDTVRAILVGVSTDRTDTGASPEAELRELSELARTAGAVPVAYHVQRKSAPDPRLYCGSGLAFDLALERQALDASLIIFDDELSPSQIRNLEALCGARIIDRTALILDIFAARAKSREGALQVELAQQKYRLPRLAGSGTSLSRLGGGIGTRGPGETKLQTDRRHILRRIHYLEQEIAEIAKRRDMIRADRARRSLATVALVGYTNAGKSTMLNALCESDVFAKDMLFATLDPSVRAMRESDGKEYLLIDTVGFIKKLPHTLIEAFKSTLEEAVHADLLIHVVESDSPDLDSKVAVVNDILDEIGAGDKPKFLVLNKTDKPGAVKSYPAGDAVRVFCTDAVSGTGMDELRCAVADFFRSGETELELLIPYSDGQIASYVRRNGTVISEEYEDTGTRVKCRLADEFLYRVRDFIDEK